MKKLAIIPARGGSKRLPRKNILPLNGKPLIAWTIQSAIDSGCFDIVCVSTDDPEIAEVSKSFGADVPFLRPSYLSSDTASSSDVVLHALDYYRDTGGRVFDVFCLLQPTSPFRKTTHIIESVCMMEDKRALSITSVCEMEHSPLWSNTLPADLSMTGFLSQNVRNLRSQDLPTYYRINGAIYLNEVSAFRKSGQFIGEVSSYAYVMSKFDSVDIDTEFDFTMAELQASMMFR